MSTGRPTKAVIPAAGLGTRFLPATKATPKEMLPVVDKPAIQYVVEEAVAAGLTDVLMVTGRNKRALEDHFDRPWSWSWRWRPRATRALAASRESTRAGAACTTCGRATRGARPRGAAPQQHVGDEPFAVLLGDDLIDRRATRCWPAHDAVQLRRRGQRRRAHGGAAPTRSTCYGCAAVEADRRAGRRPGHRPGREARGRGRPPATSR